MANNAALSELQGGRQRTLRMADYCVPLYWLACISSADVLVKERLDPDDPDDYLLHIDVASRTALERFTTRKEAIDALTDRLGAEVVEVAQCWRELLSGLSGTMRIDVTEIVGMTDDGEDELRRATRYFESPTVEAATAVLSITGLNDAFGAKPRYPIEDYLSGYQYP